MPDEDLKNALSGLDEEKVYAIVNQRLKSGAPVKQILKECQSGMRIVGDFYKKEEYFVADLVYAGEIMRRVMKILEPHMKGAGKLDKVGTVVMGTVKGDIHDLGKDVVIITLQGNGFEVVDLGVDVPAEKFVEGIKKSGARIVGMSVFLTSCFDSAAKVVQAIKASGLRNKVKIMIGGAPVTEMVAEQTGCDFFGVDAAAGVSYALKAAGEA